MKKFYVTVDTETATLPMTSVLCKNTEEKKKVSIAKPLIYDLGWVITDTQGNIVKKANYLINETFFVPQVFNTAYYADKRPQYIQKLNNGEIQRTDWNTAITELIEDMTKCNISTAFNACFDFKKAIPFTERYIKALYSEFLPEWEKAQNKSIATIIHGAKNEQAKNPDYNNPIIQLRDKTFEIADLRYLTCEKLINNMRYKNFCIDNNLFSTSGLFFRTTAESVFQYIAKQNDFIESHTALDDSIIESQILTKLLKKGKIEPTLESFAERKLGMITDFSTKNPDRQATIKSQLEKYILSHGGFDSPQNAYTKRLIAKYMSY